MKLTAISSPISATKIAKGSSVTTAAMIPVVNIGARNPDRILSSVCPATIFANSRTPSDTARARYEMISIGTSSGIRAVGAPVGTKKLKKCSLCSDSDRIVTPRKIVTLSPSATIIEVVTVNP